MRPLTQMGARFEARDEQYPPLTVHGGKLRPIDYTLPVASAQVKSSVLFAGLFGQGETVFDEPVRTRDHGELARTSSQRRSANSAAASLGVSGSNKANSSPPMRATTSESRLAETIAVATVLRTRSPTS